MSSQTEKLPSSVVGVPEDRGERERQRHFQNSRSLKKQWKAAALMTKDLPDPWEGLGFDEITEEVVTRHMYNPRSSKWKSDEVVVRIQSKPFAHGAMRECYRMKKLSKFSQNPNWRNASNYVAKRYMKEVSRETYFIDVKLQMDSKRWGEEYNKFNVPKKVDFCQTYIIEFKGREGSPLYGVEHFIDGGYIKYNSNSGFVSNVNRLTPQTFSHFTFEKSNHQLIVVDIQGVGDLYTDPQMHTVDMKDYGEANLGTRGMALFFSSHVCSPLCSTLGLTQFDLSDEEISTLHSRRWNFSSSTTKISDLTPEISENNSIVPQDAPMQTIKDLYHHLSSTFSVGNVKKLQKIDSDTDSSSFIESPLPLESPLFVNSPDIVIHTTAPVQDSKVHEDLGERHELEGVSRLAVLPLADGMGTSASIEKVRTSLRGEFDDVRGKQEEDNLRILGLIHLDMAHYHEVGRFSKEQLPNLKSALYHLTKSADCGIKESLYTLAHIYLQQPHQDNFKELAVEATPEHECKGMEYLVKAAEKGLKSAMLEVAKALDTGLGLGKAPKNSNNFVQRYQNWFEAVEWYGKVLTAPTDTDSSELLEPNYSILARMAEMYLSGGHHLEEDVQKAGELYTEAAEAAMNAMKGKLSTKFYMLAEEAWSKLPD